MRKSDIYKMAQCAILDSTRIVNDDKLEILKELISQEDVSLMLEKQEETEAAKVENDRLLSNVNR